MIEILIVLVIVAALLALAYPSYVDYVRKGKRDEAQQALMDWAINQEIWRSSHSSYAASDDMPSPVVDTYRFSISSVTTTSYTLRAMALNDQAEDKARDGTSCAILKVDQKGRKSPAACWE